MKDAPAFDFYPERWLVGVAQFSDAEQLAYVRLLCHQWLSESLPADVTALRRLAGKGVTGFLLSKFPLGDDGLRRNARLETVRLEQRARIAKSREKIARMNDARASRRASKEPLVEGLVEPLSGFLTTHHSPLTPLSTEREPQARAGAPVTEAEAWSFAKNIPASPPWTEEAVAKWWATRDRDGWHTGGATPRAVNADNWRSDLRASHGWATKIIQFNSNATHSKSNPRFTALKPGSAKSIERPRERRASEFDV